MPWIFYPISFFRRASHFVVFQKNGRISVLALFASKYRCSCGGGVAPVLFATLEEGVALGTFCHGPV